ncbi:hypothetical protein P171DRAFT_449831 [Karstenula rhodostoma CBS 690.94]|uniref:Uncharacterized protein n=1 Tax=Karstenula rhodostoma CBS 690.94 TaxID=1392251 RepID=A0A9P4P684_9PLEO|nr:hypothetical protein P171DRAFT_449831 [Karstenula rhodostoma CBS 690.94]
MSSKRLLGESSLRTRQTDPSARYVVSVPFGKGQDEWLHELCIDTLRMPSICRLTTRPQGLRRLSGAVVCTKASEITSSDLDDASLLSVNVNNAPWKRASKPAEGNSLSGEADADAQSVSSPDKEDQWGEEAVEGATDEEDAWAMLGSLVPQSEKRPTVKHRTRAHLSPMVVIPRRVLPQAQTQVLTQSTRNKRASVAAPPEESGANLNETSGNNNTGSKRRGRDSSIEVPHPKKVRQSRSRRQPVPREMTRADEAPVSKRTRAYARRKAEDESGYDSAASGI